MSVKQINNLITPTKELADKYRMGDGGITSAGVQYVNDKDEVKEIQDMHFELTPDEWNGMSDDERYNYVVKGIEGYEKENAELDLYE